MTLLPKIKETRGNMDKLLTTEIEKKRSFLKQSYDVEPKANKLLEESLKNQQLDGTIHKIKDTATNVILFEPKD